MTEEKPSSRALRQRFEEQYALPLARAVFELEPRCQSVLYAVGQFWSDEATDAVHSWEVLCEERDPTWPRAGQVRPGIIGDPTAIAELLEEAEERGEDDLPDVSDAQWLSLIRPAAKQAFGKEFFSVLDDNGDKIVAFASYCREVSDQEQPNWVSHTPYALVRRPLAGQPLTLEVVGQMHRPEWEDRWDVLEKDGLITDTEGAADRS